jgi:hypothetical protein
MTTEESSGYPLDNAERLAHDEGMTHTYRLTWTPQLSQDGYRWDGRTTEIIETTDTDALAEAWSDLMDSFHVHVGSWSDYYNVGKAAEDSLASLHIIGRGTARIVLNPQEELR